MKSDIDQGFYERANNEFGKLDLTALEFIQRHPICSKKKLANIIGNGVTARGLTMKLFEEAKQQNILEKIARDLLYRKIINEFPDGWVEDEVIRPAVKLGSWHYDILEFAPEYDESAIKILRALATTHQPNIGWKPSTANDELLLLLFKLFWDN